MFRFLLRAFLLITFALLVGFWLTVALYVGSGLSRGGLHGAGLWLLHVGLRRWEPPGPNGKAQWGLVALRFICISQP
jgi:hypothetical protein